MKKRMATSRKRIMSCSDFCTLVLCLYVFIMITLCLYLALES